MLQGIRNIIKNSGILGKSDYGKTWQDKDKDWYSELFGATPLFHQNFIEFLKSKQDVKTVLEIGCGAGVYPIQHKELFTNIMYTGIDISEPGIEHCKKNSSFNFICDDFIKMDLSEKYDLIFSQSVVDHVYDIDSFLGKIVKHCKKYAYVSSYRGYFPDLEKHKMRWNDDDGCYYNNLSVKQIAKVMTDNGLKNDEFTIRSQRAAESEPAVGTIIEIHRKQ